MSKHDEDDDGLHIDDVHGDGGEVDVINTHPTPQTREALNPQKPAKTPLSRYPQDFKKNEGMVC